MWKTFFAEFKYAFSKPLRAIVFIIMLFIPFIYGFLYMNAYWAPFHHVDQLNIVLINQDKGKKLADNLAKDMRNKTSLPLTIGSNQYKITLGTDEIYSNKDLAIVKNEINDGKWQAAIVIPRGYSEAV